MECEVRFFAALMFGGSSRSGAHLVHPSAQRYRPRPYTDAHSHQDDAPVDGANLQTSICYCQCAADILIIFLTWPTDGSILPSVYCYGTYNPLRLRGYTRSDYTPYERSVVLGREMLYPRSRDIFRPVRFFTTMLK